jgi:hypothetical protein
LPAFGTILGSQAALEQLLDSQAAIGKPEQALCKGLLEVFSQLVSRNFKLDFLYKKTAKNCENHQRSFKKYCFD